MFFYMVMNISPVPYKSYKECLHSRVLVILRRNTRSVCEGAEGQSTGCHERC